LKTTVTNFDSFLGLPDWKKVELKLCQAKFSAFPLMDYETDQSRKAMIYHIASHYGRIDVVDLIESQNKSLDNTWPRYLENIITPKILDIMDLKFFTQFGYCYCCKNYQGFNRMHYKKLNQKGNKIVPISGRCTQQFNNIADYKTKGKNFQIVKPDFSCHVWHPHQLYHESMIYLIEKKLSQEDRYPFHEYILDLKFVDFWRFFFNKYSYINVS